MGRALLLAGVRRGQLVWSHPGSRQLVRYALAGLLVTQFSAIIYSAVALQGTSPYLANLASTLCGLAAGYTIHSRWSFKDGQKDSETLQIGRFLFASLLAFLLNNLWIWLLVSRLGLHPLAPVPFMMAATPWFSFLLNRYWVFRAA
jgi:putative flippase GtrA